jgi:hypothetical protein
MAPSPIVVSATTGKVMMAERTTSGENSPNAATAPKQIFEHNETAILLMMQHLSD